MNADELIGKVLGTCTLQKLIGQGGMGAVFLAQQSRPRRQVAVKVLLPMTSLEPNQLAAFLERFRRETDAAASLEHPNIMPVHEYGECDGLAYLVMPYISGGTLRDEMELEGPLALEKVASYLDQMAAALDFAHERGVIHRDIKPANFLMTPEKRLLLTDFGLVKIVADGQTPQMRLTGAGAPVGTPDYMAPEQVMGEGVGARADLYSLGVVLYQMMTGVTPFQGETPMHLAAQHLQVPPRSPRLLRGDLPVAVEQVMLRALAKHPDDRYARGRDLASAFRLALATAGIPQSMRPAMEPLSQQTSTGARLFTPRSLFDPGWQTGSVPSVGNNPTGGLLSSTSGPLPAANASTGRSGGLLSRTGKFPQVGTGTGQLRVAMADTTTPTTPTGSLPTTPVNGFPTLTGPRPALLGLGQKATQTGALPTPTGSQPAIPVPAVNQMSPALGVVMVPGNEPGSPGVMKLTGPVKVVQVPVAGQPGRYVTGLLPVPSQPLAEPAVTKVNSKKKLSVVALLVVAVLLITSVSGGLWYFRSHSGQATKTQHGSPSPAITPDKNTLATAQATATMGANIILFDPLSSNIHSFPVNANEFFANNAYHIKDAGDTGMVVVLAQKPFSQANAYSLTIQEIKGDDTSVDNSFGMVLRFNQQTKNGKRITTFYSFEVVNTPGGEYRFYKYDDSQGASASAWTQIWHQNFGSEFHQGQGSKNVNTIKIYQNEKNFTFTVNGKQVGALQDGSFTAGTVGMLVNLNGTEVAFTNLLITYH